MIDENEYLSESNAILLYLAEKSTRPLAGGEAKAQVQSQLFAISNEIEPCV